MELCPLLLQSLLLSECGLGELLPLHLLLLGCSLELCLDGLQLRLEIKLERLLLEMEGLLLLLLLLYSRCSLLCEGGLVGVSGGLWFCRHW